MRKLVVLTVVLLVAAVSNLKAQNLNLQNTSWKMYVDQLGDTLTIHIGKDSSYVTDGGGGIVVRSLCKIAKDTLKLQDYDGKFACQGDLGVYKIEIKDDALNFTLINDPCEGRTGSLGGSKWIKVNK